MGLSWEQTRGLGQLNRRLCSQLLASALEYRRLHTIYDRYVVGAAYMQRRARRECDWQVTGRCWALEAGAASGGAGPRRPLSVEGLACFMLLHVVLALEVTARGPRLYQNPEPGTLAARFAPSRSHPHSGQVPPAGTCFWCAPGVARVSLSPAPELRLPCGAPAGFGAWVSCTSASDGARPKGEVTRPRARVERSMRPAWTVRRNSLRASSSAILLALPSHLTPGIPRICPQFLRFFLGPTRGIP